MHFHSNYSVKKLQGAFEYLLLVGGLILVVLVAGSILQSSTTTLYEKLRGYKPPEVNYLTTGDDPPEITNMYVSPTIGKPTTSFSLYCEASDDVNLSSITITVNGTTVKSCTASGTSSSCSTTYTPGTPGTFTFTCTAVDSSSQSTSLSTSFSASSDAPLVSILYPDEGASLVGAYITVQWDALDPDGTITSITVDCDGDGTPEATLPGTSTSYTCSYSADGSYTVTVTATDDTGLTGSDSVSFSLIVTESICFDSIDNDYDGLTDCADPDCDGQYCGTETFNDYCVSPDVWYDYDGDGQFDSATFDLYCSAGACMEPTPVKRSTDASLQACTACGYTWCTTTECVWSSDYNIYYQAGPYWLVLDRGPCVNSSDIYRVDVLDLSGNNTNRRSVSGPTADPSITDTGRLQMPTCVYCNPGIFYTDRTCTWVALSYEIKTYDGSLWTCYKFGTWIEGDMDKNQQLCNDVYGIWCPDCAWSPDGKIYYYSPPKIPFEDANCVSRYYFIVNVRTTSALDLSTGNTFSINAAYSSLASDRYCLLRDENGYYYWTRLNETVTDANGNTWKCTGIDTWTCLTC